MLLVKRDQGANTRGNGWEINGQESSCHRTGIFSWPKNQFWTKQTHV